MPTFRETIETDITIDPEYYIEGCNEYSKNRLIDALIEDGYLIKDCRISNAYNYSVSESVFEEALQILHGKWNSLTSEEEQLIIKIANRF